MLSKKQCTFVPRGKNLAGPQPVASLGTSTLSACVIYEFWSRQKHKISLLHAFREMRRRASDVFAEATEDCFVCQKFCLHAVLPDSAPFSALHSVQTCKRYVCVFGFASHEKGPSKTRRHWSTGRQPNTKRAFCPADKPKINRWSNADLVPSSIKKGFRLFVDIERHWSFVFLERTMFFFLSE